MKKINPLLLGIIPAIIFGFSFVFTKVALDLFDDPYHLLALRFTFAVVILTILLLLKVIKIGLRQKNYKKLLMLSLFQPLLYFVFETLGIKFSSASQAGVMIAFIPIAVSLLAVIFLKEKTSFLQMFFITISIIGVLIINSGVSITSENLMGNLLLLGAVVSAAVYQILSRKFSTDFTAIEITYVMMWVGAVVFNVIAIYNSESLVSYFEPLLDIKILGSLAYLGILSSVVAFFIINYVLSHVEATKAAVLANLTTIVAIIAGVMLLEEAFGFIKIIGSIMILIGVYGTTKVKL